MKTLLTCLLLAFGMPANADELMMARITQPFPEAMQMLQDNIRIRDYTVSRVQRVDVGFQKLAKEHYELIPYLPLNIVIFAEGDDTLILAASPLKLGAFFNKPELQPYFARWEQDMRSIFSDLKEADDALLK